MVDKSSNSVWFLLWGVAAVTLFLKTDFYDPFNSAKLILLLLVDGWSLGHLINSYKENPIIRKSQDFNITVIVISFILFLLASTIKTDILMVALLGDTQRRNGFLQYFSLIIILVYSSRVINVSYARSLIKSAVIVSFILSSYGLLQVSGKDFIKWKKKHFISHIFVMPGTIGKFVG